MKRQAVCTRGSTNSCRSRFSFPSPELLRHIVSEERFKHLAYPFHEHKSLESGEALPSRRFPTFLTRQFLPFA